MSIVDNDNDNDSDNLKKRIKQIGTIDSDTVQSKNLYLNTKDTILTTSNKNNRKEVVVSDKNKVTRMSNRQSGSAIDVPRWR